MEFLREWLMAGIRFCFFPILYLWEREPIGEIKIIRKEQIDYCDNCWANNCETYCSLCIIKQKGFDSRGEIIQIDGGE